MRNFNALIRDRVLGQEIEQCTAHVPATRERDTEWAGRLWCGNFGARREAMGDGRERFGRRNRGQTILLCDCRFTCNRTTRERAFASTNFGRTCQGLDENGAHAFRFQQKRIVTVRRRQIAILGAAGVTPLVHTFGGVQNIARNSHTNDAMRHWM